MDRKRPSALGRDQLELIFHQLNVFGLRLAQPGLDTPEHHLAREARAVRQFAAQSTGVATVTRSPRFGGRLLFPALFRPSTPPPSLGHPGRSPEYPTQFIVHDPVKRSRQTVSGIPPIVQIGERWEASRRDGSVMRCDIPPFVQFSQVLETRRIPWVSIRQIQCEAKAFEVFPQVCGWGCRVEGAMGRELRLDEDAKRSAHPECGDFGRFGVKVGQNP